MSIRAHQDARSKVEVEATQAEAMTQPSSRKRAQPASHFLKCRASHEAGDVPIGGLGQSLPTQALPLPIN